MRSIIGHTLVSDGITIGFAPSVLNSVYVGHDMRTRSTRSPTRNVDVPELKVDTSSSRRDCSLY